MVKKICYAIIALLFGSLGIHNFIEKNNKSGLAKLIITICAAILLSGWVFYTISALISVWVIFDIVDYCLNSASYKIENLFKLINKNKK